jgi:2-phospho-L-lactate/phosphoenolpyruvate guanylyltransferase
MRTAAILPVKRFDRAKSRLAADVAEQLRSELARAMVADVLLALARTESIERTIVVTREPSLRAEALEHRAALLADDLEDGQSAAVTLGVRLALEDGMQRILCIPGDCPALDPAELDALLGAHGDGDKRREVVIVPDRHGSGTNGLLLTPPDAILPSFGPGSCERHRELAHAAGVECRLEHPSSLLLDIDTGADLDALRDQLAELAGADARAARTRAVLGRSERDMILSTNHTL